MLQDNLLFREPLSVFTNFHNILGVLFDLVISLFHQTELRVGASGLCNSSYMMAVLPCTSGPAILENIEAILHCRVNWVPVNN
jgi:hypothetical protein